MRRWEEEALFPPIRICPLLGFVDESGTRVGCLAHPAVTGGADLRDCGAYDRRTCADFECPSFLWLSPGHARLVRETCRDWYLYGLVITDVELVRGLFALLAREAGRTIEPEELLACPAALQATARFFALKEDAPDRPPRADVFGRFAADDLGEPLARSVEYDTLGVGAAPEDDVVLCLGYAPATAAALERARGVVREHVRAVAAALA